MGILSNDRKSYTFPLRAGSVTGSTSLQIAFSDVAGNSTMYTTQPIAVIDTTPPVLTFDTKPPILTNSGVATFSISAREDL